MSLTAAAAGGSNLVSSVKLPDECHTQRETLLELCRVHFPDSRLTDGSTDGQGQLDLGGCTCRTNREDWNLVRRVIDQSKVKWAINTFKPLKSAETDGIVPALLQHGLEYLVSHLCCIFRGLEAD
jgi:hypothetical protein